MQGAERMLLGDSFPAFCDGFYKERLQRQAEQQAAVFTAVLDICERCYWRSLRKQCKFWHFGTVQFIYREPVHVY